MPRVSSDHLQARRRQILDGARVCFARFGYEGATVRRLEEATGLSRGAIFHHYGDKDGLFLALASHDSARVAELVAERGLVEVMRALVAASGGEAAPEWLVTQLEVNRRLRTDPAFAATWAAHSRAVSAAVRERLARQRAAGAVRDDVDLEVLASFLELALDGVVGQLATGADPASLGAVVDLVEEAVRRAWTRHP